jgi:hypothetical protein
MPHIVARLNVKGGSGHLLSLVHLQVTSTVAQQLRDFLSTELPYAEDKQSQSLSGAITDWLHKNHTAFGHTECLKAVQFQE